MEKGEETEGIKEITERQGLIAEVLNSVFKEYLGILEFLVTCLKTVRFKKNPH